MDRNAVVQKAVKLLINVPPNEVDEVLAQIRQELVGKYKVYTAEELLVIANEQIARLKERLAKLVESGKVTQEQVDAIVTCLESKREVAIAKVADVPIIGTHLPLLAAISKKHLTCSIQMKMVQLGEKTGINYLDDGEITDEVDLPKGVVWWAIDVEDGEQFLTDETAPQDEEAIIAEQGRLCCVVTEAIALGIHANVLERHNVDAPGSQFLGADGVPVLYLVVDGPKLSCNDVVYASAEWGSASCSSRV